jgi:hypothetical protein
MKEMEWFFLKKEEEKIPNIIKNQGDRYNNGKGSL